MIWTLFLHWLADFVFQTDWMALNKSKSRAALGAHVGVYSLVILIGMVLACPWTHWSFFAILGLVAVNAACHYATDGITSKISGHLFKQAQGGNAEARRKFWWVIGFDQFIHVATLAGLMKLFL